MILVNIPAASLNGKDGAGMDWRLFLSRWENGRPIARMISSDYDAPTIGQFERAWMYAPCCLVPAGRSASA